LEYQERICEQGVLTDMIKGILKTGDKIEIVTHYGLINKEKSSYSLVQDVPEDRALLITLPMAGGQPVILEPGQTIRVNFYRDDGEFYFSAKVTERLKSDVMLLIKIIQISSIDRLQRRNFFRLKKVLPVRFRYISDDKAEGRYYKGHAMDISGGGIRLYTDRFMPTAAQIECKIKIDEKQEIVLNGKVLRVRKVQDTEHQYDIGISFVDIPEIIRDRIISFIFEQQRFLRNKGLDI